jgi:hypothetical protein
LGRRLARAEILIKTLGESLQVDVGGVHVTEELDPRLGRNIAGTYRHRLDSPFAADLSYLDLYPMFIAMFHTIDERQSEPHFKELLVDLVERWRASRRKIELYAPHISAVSRHSTYVGYRVMSGPNADVV